ncbi:MAG: hypothetical protein JXB50_15665, partial [Spirochaetes bacterium]|nr:hypothetical protein [Spirochaetota bacterium]
MKYKRIYINIIFFLLFILRFIAPQDIKNNQNGSINSKAPFKVLYNNDSTNIYHCISPWHGSKEPINDEMIEKSIEEVSNSSVDAYMFTDGRGWIPFRQSKVYPDHYEWWMKRTGKNPDAFGKYILDGGDMIKTAVNACKKYNMAAFVSYRLNDVHLLEFAETKHSNSIWCSRFYIEHPEYRLYPLESQTYSVKNGQNWAVKEVRDHKFAFIKEICENYDIDGIELDFMRSGMLFRTDQTSEKERISIINNFIKETRTLLNQTVKHGKRRYLCLRIPHYAYIHKYLGINIPDLVNLGVDMLILSSHFFTAQKSGYAEIRKTAPETAIYIEMTHVSSDVRFSGGSVVYTSGGPYPRTSDHQFYTTAYKSLMIGYDGVSLFNFVYYRPQSEPPFH